MPRRTQKKGCYKKISGGSCRHHSNAIKEIIGTAHQQQAGTRKRCKKCPKSCHCPKSCCKMRRKHKGGSSTENPNKHTPQATAFQTYGFPPGAGTQREAAIANNEANTAAQVKANRAAGVGGRRKRKTKNKRHYRKRTRKLKKKNYRRRRRTNKMRGGDQPKKLPVPSFRPPGGVAPGPMTASRQSMKGNINKTQSTADAVGDHYAYNKPTPPVKSGGGGFLSWHQVFPPGNFGRRMTGPNILGGKRRSKRGGVFDRRDPRNRGR